MTASSVELAGLDGSSPLGFLAALGLLKILDDAGRNPRLSWREHGGWRPVVHGTSADEEVIAAVSQDVLRWHELPVLRFRYVRVTKAGPEPFGGLNPPIAVFRPWLEALSSREDLDALDYACALMTETATFERKAEGTPSIEDLEKHATCLDPSLPLGIACMQTPFDFSSRNMQFLDQADKIRQAVAAHPEWIRSALFEGSPVSEDVPTMGWDVNAKVPGAQYATRAVARYPVPEWLAFRGLVCLPIFGSRDRVGASACRGRRLQGQFVWPIWIPPVTTRVVTSLLSYPKIEELSSQQLDALGVAQVFRAGLAKLGKYDAILTPSEPLRSGTVASSLGDAVAPVALAASAGEAALPTTTSSSSPPVERSDVSRIPDHAYQTAGSPSVDWSFDSAPRGTWRKSKRRTT